MTTNSAIEVKSRRAHSPHLDNPELFGFFDPQDFAKSFERLNPDLIVWDATKGELQ